MTDLDDVASRYLAFADQEAAGSSPSFEAWARQVADSPEVLRRIASLPPAKQQPNLVFAALRWHDSTPGNRGSLATAFATKWEAIEKTILRRSTQTNEAARCAIVLPLLNEIDGPLFLIEVGAAAGLCMIPDAYSYRYSTGESLDPAGGPSAVILDTEVISGSLPSDLAIPEIVWRAGIDLNPLDAADHEVGRWLENLIWPEHEARRERLRAALSLASDARLRIDRGDLIDLLPGMIDEAPSGTTVVVLHSAALAYLPAEPRQAVLDIIATSRARRIGFEGRGLLGPDDFEAPRAGDSLFAADLDGHVKALANGHGTALRLIQSAA